VVIFPSPMLISFHKKKTHSCHKKCHLQGKKDTSFDEQTCIFQRSTASYIHFKLKMQG
jgi:hypothetical protein